MPAATLSEWYDVLPFLNILLIPAMTYIVRIDKRLHLLESLNKIQHPEHWGGSERRHEH